MPLPAGSASLRRTSVALCHQATTLDRAKLTEPMGALGAELLSRVDDALRAALDLV